MMMFFSIMNLYAQKNHLLIIVSNDSSEKIIRKSHPMLKHNSAIEAGQAAGDLLFDLYQRGYITASIDSTYSDSLSTKIWLYTGPEFRFISLRKGNLDKFLMNEANFKEKYYEFKTFKYDELIRLSEKLLKYCENNGYPFATFNLDSIEVSDSCVSAAVRFEKNNRIEIDSIVVKGNARLSRSYIYNYLGIKPGSLYNESLLAGVSRKMRELPFASEIKPFEIVFTPEHAKLYLYMAKKKASVFNGVLGIAPNDKTSGKLLLTGELKLSLLNSFGRGELIDLQWRSISKGTQDLKINLAYPYLFSTPFGLNYKFMLFKKDTSYLTMSHNIGVQFFFRGNNYVKAVADIYRSDLLSTDGLETATVLPEYADIALNLFGLETRFENFDYKINPRKAYYIHFSGGAGIKTIKKNQKINPLLYDSLKLKTTQFKLFFQAGMFIPLIRKTTLWLASENAGIINKTIFTNELFKLGGMYSLRGFDEESIPVSFYSMLTVEFRYLFERNSYLCAFWNGAYYERNTYNSYTHDMPYGFGLGVAFDTKIGMFILNYALGSEHGQPILLKQSKIHFGFMNTF